MKYSPLSYCLIYVPNNANMFALLLCAETVYVYLHVSLKRRWSQTGAAELQCMIDLLMVVQPI